MERELDTMREMEMNQAGVNSATAAAAFEDEDKGFPGDGGVLALSRRVSEAVEIKGLLERNTDEVDSLMKALEGSYVKPGVGGESDLMCRASPSCHWEGEPTWHEHSD